MIQRLFGGFFVLGFVLNYLSLSETFIDKQLTQILQYILFAFIGLLVVYLINYLRKHPEGFGNLPVFPKFNRSLEKRNLLYFLACSSLPIIATLFLINKQEEDIFLFWFSWGFCFLAIYGFSLIFKVIR